MGFLTTFTVYNDDCYEITKKPKEFANEIFLACSNPNIGYRSNVFHGVVIPQRTRHADDKTIYVHAGNTVCEMCPYSDITTDLMVNHPEFFKEILQLMEKNVRELQKQFNGVKKSQN